MTDHVDLSAFIEAFSGVRIACVGDVMLDRYVSGSVDRISPEAPIPVLDVKHQTAMPGGAGNLARNLIALGASVDFAAAVGDDEAAEELRALLSENSRIKCALITEPGRTTAIKTRFLSGDQQLLRADEESVGPVSGPTRSKILDAVRVALTHCHVMVLSDYGKGVIDNPLAGTIITAARAAGKPVIVDPKGRNYERFRGADIVTPNRKELFDAVGVPIVVGDETLIARKLIDEFELGAVLVTLGKDGMTVVPADGDAVSLPAETREVFDVTGAGDTVVAALAAALGAGATLHEAAALANIAAGIVVGKVGTAVAYASEVSDALRHQDLSRAEAKVLTLEATVDRVEKWRRKGLKVGFTNGCFDLLHPGHISLLSQAKSACDRLVVGLNNDGSISRLKGSGRPVQRESARAAVLASLATVDSVVVFAEDTPLRVIEALRPDVLVKGADWQLDAVVGADLVRGFGGDVLLARLEPGYSTSATIARMDT
jgi:D-beta-D-heptose 7-phosphate kinase/D-beta-D-heptose 1-phosphate adenosyltransferase